MEHRQRCGAAAPDDWPLWTFDVRPGARKRHECRPRRSRPAGRNTDWVSDGALTLADLGYEGEPETFTIPFKKPMDVQPTIDQQAYTPSTARCAAWGERANSLLKTTYKALRRYRGCPWRLGDITAAALVLLHHEHSCTTQRRS